MFTKQRLEYFEQQHTLQNASGQVTGHSRDQDTHQAGSQNWATALQELALQTVVTIAQEEPEHKLCCTVPKISLQDAEQQGSHTFR